MTGYYEEISQPDPPLVQRKDFYTAKETAWLMGISIKRVWTLARRDDDPLPLRRMIAMKRGSIVFHDELIEWMKRNYLPIGKLKGKR